MSQERTINDIVENLASMLVAIAKENDTNKIKKAVAIMEEGWNYMDEFDFNKELATLWRQSQKARKEIKS